MDKPHSGEYVSHMETTNSLSNGEFAAAEMESAGRKALTVTQLIEQLRVVVQPDVTVPYVPDHDYEYGDWFYWGIQSVDANGCIERGPILKSGSMDDDDAEVD